MRTIKKLVSAKEFTLFIVMVAIFILFSAINKNFIAIDNVRNIFNSAFVVGTIAVGMSCLLIAGQLDLSAANTGMMAGVLIALMMAKGIPWVPALLVILVFGAVTGLVNAYLVNVLNFTAFISTLGISTVYGGLALVFTNAQNVSIANKQFWQLGSINVFGVFPLPFFIMVILLIAYGVILYVSRFGRRIYMVGGNPNAARLAGVNPKKVTTILFVNNSVISVIVGSLLAARMHMGSPLALADSDLDAITAAVLGGVSFTGGSGNMAGVFLGIMLLTGFQNGLIVVGLDSYYRVVAKGALLIAALALDFYRERSRQKSMLSAKA
ncbi:MAG: ABC transporter permease [Oscillospiraceae bacterium]|jgi:ribose transport system permease protein|nr:ABC transporter permease [Oscillospiraceae bacterium]